MRKIVYLLIVSFLQAQRFDAQHFDWASSGSGMNAGMKFGVITANGDVVTGMQHESMSYNPMNIEPCMYGAAGDSLPLSYLGTEMVIFSYDHHGKIKWSLRSKFASNTYLLGMVAKKNGNVVIAYTANWMTGKIDVLPAPKELQGNSEFGIEDEPDEGDVDLFEGKDRFDGRETNVSYSVVFSEVNKYGDIVNSTALMGLDGEAWSDFKMAPDGGYLISYEQNLRARDVLANPREPNHNFVVKLDPQLNFSWVHKVRFLGGDGNFIPTSGMTVSPGGDIYIFGNAHHGVRLPGAKDHRAPILDEVTQYNQPYDSYIAKLNSKGAFQWVKYTEGKSILYDITADDKHVFIGGTMRLSNQFIGIPMDTTGAKNAFLGCLDVNGKTKWVKNYRTNTVRTLHADQHGNVFVQFESKSTQYDPPLIIGKDTLTNSYSDLIVSLFNAKGEVQWTKSSNVMINERSDGDPVMISDECGNIYIVAEMWYVLPVNMSVFDGALVRGLGYGAAPLVARIRTTLPAELESINTPLTAGLTLSPIDREHTENENGNCIPIPAPWKLEILPNPNKGIFQARATLSFTDKYATLEIYDTRGSFSCLISNHPLLESGTHTFDCELPELANGLYILVLRGSGGAVSERVVISK